MILSRLLLLTTSLLFSAVSLAQNLSIADVPPCPQSCLIKGLSTSTCALLDHQCQCKDQELSRVTTDCVMTKCSVAEAYILSKFQAELCDRPKESQQKQVRGWLICQLTAVGVTSLLRLYSCWKVKGGLFPEDYLIIVAVLLCGLMSSLVFLMVNSGFALHVYQIVSEAAVAKIYYYFWITELTYAITINTIKISLLCLFLRIFPNRRFRLVCTTMIVFLISVALMWCLLLTFQCTPVSGNWNIHKSPRKCYNVQIYAYVGAGSSMVEDIIIMILPIPLLLQLQVSLRQKIGVLFLFSLGIFVVITSAVRIRSIYLFGSSADPSWDNVDISIWTAFEIAVAIICCNMPSIAGLITYYRRAYFPKKVNKDAESQRHLKWTETNATGGTSALPSPRFGPSPEIPPSPRFPPHMKFPEKDPEPRTETPRPTTAQSANTDLDVDLERGTGSFRRIQQDDEDEEEEYSWPLKSNTSWPQQEEEGHTWPLKPASFHSRASRTKSTIPSPILIEPRTNEFEMAPSPRNARFPPRVTSLEKNKSKKGQYEVIMGSGMGILVTRDVEVRCLTPKRTEPVVDEEQRMWSAI